jgi:1-aminocyclopropane-1-carboxylate deaminase
MIPISTPTTKIELPILNEKGVTLWMKRDELTHPTIQGNKWRKLKYNLQYAKENNIKNLLTYGGPVSNHIYSTAAAGLEYGFKTIGIIRGYAHLPLTPTLLFAKKCGMELIFLDKQKYTTRYDTDFLKSIEYIYGEYHLIPDGGANELALKGVTELFDEIEFEYDVCCVAIGTGTTVAGAILHPKNKSTIGFSSLKGEGVEEEINRLLEPFDTLKNKWQINKEYQFGGYGKTTKELLDFVTYFKTATGIQLDPIYTSKMLFGILDMVEKNRFEVGISVLALHTGGLQGWSKYTTP